LVPQKNITTFTLNTWKWQVSLFHFQRSIYREPLQIQLHEWYVLTTNCAMSCDRVTIDEFWIDDGFTGPFHTARDYTLQFAVTNMVIFSHAFFLLLGSSSNSGHSSSSGFRNWPRPQLQISISNSSQWLYQTWKAIGNLH
jgi:hypothetical protein